jgi:hypothetical protein
MAGYFIGFTISINSYFVVMQKQGNWSGIKACKKNYETVRSKNSLTCLPVWLKKQSNFERL